jgi:hypothetical protein
MAYPPTPTYTLPNSNSKFQIPQFTIKEYRLRVNPKSLTRRLHSPSHPISDLHAGDSIRLTSGLRLHLLPLILSHPPATLYDCTSATLRGSDFRYEIQTLIDNFTVNLYVISVFFPNRFRFYESVDLLCECTSYSF